MFQNEQLSITVPKQLLEELAEAIAANLAARLDTRMCQITSVRNFPAASEKSKPKPTFLRLREVTERVGFSRSTIYNKMSEGRFPRSVKLSERCVAWKIEDIEAWERDPTGYYRSETKD